MMLCRLVLKTRYIEIEVVEIPLFPQAHDPGVQYNGGSTLQRFNMLDALIRKQLIR